MTQMDFQVCNGENGSKVVSTWLMFGIGQWFTHHVIEKQQIKVIGKVTHSPFLFVLAMDDPSRIPS
ncbi:hypothetical protein HanIR_Chr06g0260881 [Helianthus annuus]|nr:hypothetical protein HanIR_Chr06g0260881 [Helianthus annuus]